MSHCLWPSDPPGWPGANGARARLWRIAADRGVTGCVAWHVIRVLWYHEASRDPTHEFPTRTSTCAEDRFAPGLGCHPEALPDSTETNGSSVSGTTGVDPADPPTSSTTFPDDPLAMCELPEPCPAEVFLGCLYADCSQSQIDDLRCVWKLLHDGDVARFRARQRNDASAWLVVDGTDRTILVPPELLWWVGDLSRCPLKPPEFFQGCLDAVGIALDDCLDIDSWIPEDQRPGDCDLLTALKCPST